MLTEINKHIGNSYSSEKNSASDSQTELTFSSNALRKSGPIVIVLISLFAKEYIILRRSRVLRLKDKNLAIS